MSHPYQESYLKVLRWMRENIHLASGVYRTTGRRIAVDPALSLDALGNPVRGAGSDPGDLHGWFLNSVTGLVCCCYMDALGKASQQGKRAFALNHFAQAHMPDFVAECDTKRAPFNSTTLYTVYRCGFVHGFASAPAVWDRLGRDGAYWFEGPNRQPGLNVDRLAEGVLAGIDRFEAAFDSQVRAGNATYERFFEWLDK